MRTRKEIEAENKTYLTDVVKRELLLDIRDLLIELTKHQENAEPQKKEKPNSRPEIPWSKPKKKFY